MKAKKRPVGGMSRQERFAILTPFALASAAVFAWLAGLTAFVLVLLIAGLAVQLVLMGRYRAQRTLRLQAVGGTMLTGLLVGFLAGPAARLLLMPAALACVLVALGLLQNASARARAARALRRRRVEEDDKETTWSRDRAALGLTIPILVLAVLLVPAAAWEFPFRWEFGGGEVRSEQSQTSDRPGQRGGATSPGERGGTGPQRTRSRRGPEDEGGSGGGSTRRSGERAARHGSAGSGPQHPPDDVGPGMWSWLDSLNLQRIVDEILALLERLMRWIARNPWPVLAATVVAIVLAVRALRRRARLLAGAPADAGSERSAWDELLADLARLGHRRRRSQTSCEFADQVVTSGGAAYERLVAITARRQAERFGGLALTHEDQQAIEDFRASLRK